MSDITRDDLWVNGWDAELGRYDLIRVTDEEFDRLAREAGYHKLSDPVTVDRLIMDAVEQFPAKALRALLTDDCNFCVVGGDLPVETWTCPVCGGRGWTPKDGVDLIEPWEEFTNGDPEPGLFISFDWLGAEDE